MPTLPRNDGGCHLLLRQVAATDCVSAATRALGMSQKRAWQLIDSLYQGCGRPVVDTAMGKGSGGSTLTRLGRAPVKRDVALVTGLNTSAA
jgi:molybdate transport system regulatory protein